MPERVASARTTTKQETRRPRRGRPEPSAGAVVLVLVLSVLLFAMMLRGAHILVVNARLPSIAAIQVTTFLSSMLLASLLLGGAAGLAAVRGLAGRDGLRLAEATGRRTLLAVGGGLLAGLLGGAAGYLLEGELATGQGLTVAACIAVAGLLGGAAAALRPPVMVLAGLTGTVVVIVVLALRSLFLHPLTRLFGGEGTVAAYATAQSWLALVSLLVAGVIAGVAVHLSVRRTGNTLRTTATMVAGGGAGLLSLLAQLLTWVGGGRLIAGAGGLDMGDQAAFRVAGQYQIVGAVALFFAGALVAVIAYGRTLGRRQPRRRARPPAAKPEWAVREEHKAAERDRAAADAKGPTPADEHAAASDGRAGKPGVEKAPATKNTAKTGDTKTGDTKAEDATSRDAGTRAEDDGTEPDGAPAAG